jgi:hypothetical protein
MTLTSSLGPLHWRTAADMTGHADGVNGACRVCLSRKPISAAAGRQRDGEDLLGCESANSRGCRR